MRTRLPGPQPLAWVGRWLLQWKQTLPGLSTPPAVFSIPTTREILTAARESSLPFNVHLNLRLCPQVPPSSLQPALRQVGSPGVKALLAAVVGQWRLPAAGQGRVCAGTLGLLLDPGGGAVESYCGGGGGRMSSRHLPSEDQLGSPMTASSPLWVSVFRDF